MRPWQSGFLKASLMLSLIGLQLTLALDSKLKPSHNNPSLTTSQVPSRPSPNHGAIITASPSRDKFGFQFQAVMCPEMMEGELYNCDDEWCGGEDPNRPGYCTKREPHGCQCQCRHGSSTTTASPSLTTVILTEQFNGTNMTATYTRVTLSDYTSLRKHKTVTTVITTTSGTATNNAAEPLATVVGVVAAGGLMWVLADLLAGGAGVGEVINWDPAIPEDGGDSEHESDDEECPDQDPKCPDVDCNGNFLGLCTTPPNENCPCNQCPPVDELMCSDELCAGVGDDKDLHGRCTADKSLKDCSCSYPPCPVVRVGLSNGQVEWRPNPPLCADCGGPIGWGIPHAIQCKGIKVSNSDKLKYEKCYCKPSPDDEPFIADTSEVKAKAEKLAYAADPSRNSPFIWDLDKTLHLADSSCNVSAPAARQEEPGWVIQYDYLKPPSVAAAIQDFCNATQGEDVSFLGREYEVFLVATPQDDYPERRVPTWLSVRRWDDRPASHDCSSTNNQSAFSIDYNECTSAFALANWACSDNTLHLTRGGGQPGYCLAYEISISETYDGLSPPWSTPEDPANVAQCSDDGIAGNKAVAASGVEGSFWMGTPTKFCNSTSTWTDRTEWGLTALDWTSNGYTIVATDDPMTDGLPKNTPPSKYGNPWRFYFGAYDAQSCTYDDCLSAFNSVQQSSCAHQSTNYTQITSSGYIKPPAWAVSSECAATSPYFAWTVIPPITYNSALLTNLSDPSNYPANDNSIEPANITAADLYQWNVTSIFCNSNLIIPHPLPEDPYDSSRAALEISLAPPLARDKKVVRVEATFAGDRTGGVGPLGNECVNMNAPEAQVNSGGDRCVEMLAAAIYKFGSDPAAGVITMEHEDPRGCVIYSIVGYNRDYRLMAAQATQAFLEAWSGGGSSKWNGTEVFKGNRTAKAGGKQKPKGDKQPQGKARFE